MCLKKKFLIILILAFGITLCIAYCGYVILRDNISYSLGNLFLKKQIQFNRERVLQPLNRDIVLVNKLATSPELIKWAEHENNPILKKQGIAELESYREFFHDKCYFIAFKSSLNYYFNGSSPKLGNQLSYKLQPDKPDNLWFVATIKRGGACLLNVDHDEKLDVTKVWINKVLKDGDKVLGVVGTGIDLQEFIDNVVGSSQNGITNILVDDKGAIQAHKNLDKIDYRSVSKIASDRKTFFEQLDRKKDKIALSKAIKESKYGKAIIPVFFARINGSLHLVGVGYIKEINWYNVSMINVEKVISDKRFIPFAGLILGSILIFLLLIYLLLDRFIFNRILRLDQSVQAFSEGIVPEFPCIVIDEIGNLENSFEEVIKIIKANESELETKIHIRTSELEKKNYDLVKALDEIKVLTGLLPICAHCKNIRNDKGYWEKVEIYMSEHTKFEFTHGICPDCMQKYYSEYVDDIKKRKQNDSL